MPKRYPPEFRRAACARLVAGEKVIALSEELGVSEATLYLCQRPLGIPHWRPLEFPRDGHENSPRTATEFPGPSTGEGHHPLARGGVDQADRFAFGDDDVGMVQEPVNES